MSYNISPVRRERDSFRSKSHSTQSQKSFYLKLKEIPRTTESDVLFRAKVILPKAKRIKFYIQIASPYDGERGSFRVQTTPLKAKKLLSAEGSFFLLHHNLTLIKKKVFLFSPNKLNAIRVQKH